MRILFLLLSVLSVNGAVINGPVLGGCSCFNGTGSSLTNVTVYWNLNEASGNRVDIGPNGQDLTDNDTVGSNAGRINVAADFVAANTEWLSRADSTTLSTGDVSYTFNVWVFTGNWVAFGAILTKDDGGVGSQREYSLRNIGATGFEWTVSTNGTDSVTTGTIGPPGGGSLLTSTWYMVTVWHDADNDQIGIAINADTPTTVADTNGSFDSTTAFNLGATNGTFNFFGGRIDECSFWKGRVLTSDERTRLYCSGQGRYYCP